jgi:hypothetical protein
MQIRHHEAEQGCMNSTWKMFDQSIDLLGPVRESMASMKTNVIVIYLIESLSAKKGLLNRFEINNHL